MRSEAGFTLIEALVAMAVLAVGAVTLLTATERHAAQTRGLADRIAARWVAENVLAREMLGAAPDPRWTAALGRDWSVDTERAALSGTGLASLRVSVGTVPGESLVSVTGYLPARGGQ